MEERRLVQTLYRDLVNMAKQNIFKKVSLHDADAGSDNVLAQSNGWNQKGIHLPIYEDYKV